MPFSVQFVPWREIFARGIFVSSTFKNFAFFRKLFELYEKILRGQITTLRFQEKKLI